MAELGLIVLAALATLAGSEWGLGSEAKSKQFVQFKETEVLGHAGCNRFFGRYTFDGRAIRIGPLASTRMMCALDVMEAERKWIAMLEAARVAEATHKELVLKDAAGAVVGRLNRRDWD
ncbi:MAG: META domain-containing protein [Hyphomicrobiaceae bacterium]